MPIIIAVANQKSGCGKTTVSMNVAGALAREGNYKVLLINADPQASAMQWRKNSEESALPSMSSRFLIRCCTRKSAHWRPRMTSFLLIARRGAGATQDPGILFATSVGLLSAPRTWFLCLSGRRRSITTRATACCP